MLHAENRQAIRAKTTASGSAPPANATPAGIDAAIAAPGAISVMLWKRTSRSPTASRLSPVSAITAPGVRKICADHVTFIGSCHDPDRGELRPEIPIRVLSGDC